MKKTFLIIVCSICIASTVNVYLSQKKGEINFSLLFNNLEALAQGEGGAHGEIDDTLVRYKILSSKKELMVILGQLKEVTFPCCKSSTSPYSGCAAGLNDC